MSFKSPEEKIETLESKIESIHVAFENECIVRREYAIRNDELEAENKRLMSYLNHAHGILTHRDYDPCRLDHHGYCQEHHQFSVDPCPLRDIGALIDNIETLKKEEVGE